MATVEEALGRLDGVTSVSAGYRSDSALVAVAKNVTLDLETVNQALKSTKFSCLAIGPAPRD